MIKQINEELSIKDSMRQQLTIKELFSRQFSKEAGKFTEELKHRKVDEGATQSKKTFQEKVWGGCTCITEKSCSTAECTRQQLLDKRKGFIEQISHLCQHREAGEPQRVYHHQQKKLWEMLEETEKLRNWVEAGNKDMQSLKERSPPALGELQLFFYFCFKDFRHSKSAI